MDLNQFNEDMNNMAQTMQQMMPQPMMSFNQPPMFHQPQQQQQQQQQQYQQRQQHIQSQTFINVTHSQPQQFGMPQPPQLNQMQSFVDQMQNFAQGMANYSQQMVRYSQSIQNQMMHQNQQNNFQQHAPQNNNNNNNAAIVFVDQAFISPQIQQIHHNLQHINASPFGMNNIQNQAQNQFAPVLQDDVIDLTGNEEDADEINEDQEEEEKEEFVPWKDEDIPNEFKCPISLEIMSEPVICSGK